MNVTSLRSLLLRELRRTRETESTIESSLLVWSDRPAPGTLRETLKIFLDRTRQRIENLDRVLQLIGPPVDISIASEQAPIVQEIEQLIAGIDDEAARDAAMRASLALLGHYLVAHYGSLTSWAERLRDADLSKLLKAPLDKEREALFRDGAATTAPPKDSGMGDRLTALFDRKK